VWYLKQNTGAITGVRLAAFRAAMLQIDEDLKRPPHDVVRLAAGNIDDKADAARVVFELRIV
jgi:hypothetical protein